MRIDDVDETKEIYFDKVSVVGTTAFIPDDDRCRDQLQYFLNSIDINNYEEIRETICLDEAYKIYFDLKYRVGKKHTKLELSVFQKGQHVIKEIQTIKISNTEICDKIKQSLMYRIG